jgi:hypothetical protein
LLYLNPLPLHFQQISLPLHSRVDGEGVFSMFQLVGNRGVSLRVLDLVQDMATCVACYSKVVGMLPGNACSRSSP